MPGERVHALLAALACEHPRAVGDARLVEQVWGLDETPTNPVKALQVLVSRARTHTAAEVVGRAGQGYRLGVDDVDLLLRRAHVAAGRTALDAGEPAAARDRARAALAVPVAAVAGVAGVEAGPLAALREQARSETTGAREVLALALAATGEHPEALPLLEDAVAASPADERLLEGLLRSEAAVRGAPAALARYERHRQDVRDLLGTDPGPALQRLHVELLARDRPVRQGLLHAATRLIGRDEDVAALSSTIRSSRVTSIVGAGGLGKTRLAHVVGRLADQPVVHFVELAGVTSPDGVVVEVGSVLGVRESVTARRLHAPAPAGAHGTAQRRDLHARILEQLGAAPTLLILDNCEHVVEAVAELVTVLVTRAPMLRVLTTSRAPLGLASERVYPLPQLAHADAVALFAERATAARPGVRLDDERVAALVDRLDGLPLALELAAAKVRVMSVEEVERRLGDRFALLRGGSRDAPERHRTLLAVIDWSWNLLTEEEQGALRRLSVFRDGFSLDGAAAVVGVDDAVGLVAELVDQSLVDVHEGEAVRYRLLETVREFGRMRLVDAGEDARTEQRLRRWAVRLAGRLADRLASPEQVTAMAEVRVEEGNLVDVLRHALAERDHLGVVTLMALLSSYWSVEGSHLKVVNLAAQVEDVVAEAPVPPDLEDPLRLVLCALVVNTMIFSSAPSPRALAALRRVGPGTEGGRAAALATVLLRLTREDAFAQPEVLEDLYVDPDPRVALVARQWTSQARENLGDLDGAFEAAQAGLDLCDDSEGPWMRAMLTAQLAVLAAQRGDAEASRDYTERALPVMERLGAVEDCMQLKALLATSDIAAGNLDDAERLLSELAEQDRGRTVIGGLMVDLCGRAELALARGRTEDGLALYREAVRSLRQHRFPGVETSTELTPWVLYPQAAALAAHALHGPSRPDAEADALYADLLRKLGGLLRDTHGFLDFPVTGAIVLALGLWRLTRDDDRDHAGLERAVRLLVMADALAYNRMLPSLSWEFAAAVAERRRPGTLATYRAELAGRTALDLRDDARRLVAQLA